MFRAPGWARGAAQHEKPVAEERVERGDRRVEVIRTVQTFPAHDRNVEPCGDPRLGGRRLLLPHSTVGCPDRLCEVVEEELGVVPVREFDQQARLADAAPRDAEVGVDVERFIQPLAVDGVD